MPERRTTEQNGSPDEGNMSVREAEAEEVISWRYPGEYSFYDMERDVEDTRRVAA